MMCAPETSVFTLSDLVRKHRCCLQRRKPITNARLSEDYPNGVTTANLNLTLILIIVRFLKYKYAINFNAI